MEKNILSVLTEVERNAFQAMAGKDREASLKVQEVFAAALRLPLYQAVMNGDSLDGIFSPETLAGGAQAIYPLDFLAPGQESWFVAYDMPKQGRVPERHVEGDEVYVHTYRIANAIDWDLSYVRNARWNIISSAIFRS